jgi:pimeloyl-ACP methyl ester carboxylesterase
LRALVLCDTRAAADTPEARLNRIKQAERVVVNGPAFVAEAMLPKLFAPSTAKTNPSLIETIKQVILATAPETIAAAQRGMAERFDMQDLLGKIDQPTLVVCGEHDAISPVDEMRGMAAAIPNSQFEVIANAGHMSPAESPVAFNAMLRDWLEKLP